MDQTTTMMAASSPSSSSSSTIPPAIRVVEQCRISPSRDGCLLRKPSLPITFFDILYLGGYRMERLFFYHWPGLTTPNFVASALPRLKRSLYATLRYYYPLAGSLRQLLGDPDRFEIRCRDGDSVPFTVAEFDGPTDQWFFRLAGDHPRGVDTLRPLIPEIPAADNGDDLVARMALQVTVFPGAGVCIGVSAPHLACDGSSFMGFVKAWASACRSAEDAVPPAGDLPVVDRTLLSDPNGLYAVLYDGMKRLIGGEFLSLCIADGLTIVRSTFILKRTHIEQLRHRVSEQRPPPAAAVRYSSFVLTCAYFWVCLLKAREQPPPPAGDAAHLIFPADYRGRLRPPLPAAYFGNCIGVSFVDARRSDLVGEGGVGRAAEAIAKTVASLGDGGDVLRGAEEWIAKSAARLPGRPLMIAGSPRFGVYGTDFGWGLPAKVEVVGNERLGTMALAESRDDDGGIEVGLVMPAPEMTKFSSVFAAGLEVAA